MPIYEYRCEGCGTVFEKIQKGFDEHPESCPQCGGRAGRIMSNTSFVLKGSGWYVTDYCNRNSGAESAKSGGSGDNGGNGAKADAPAPKSAGSGAAVEKPAASPSCAAKGCGATCDVAAK
ncbi:FmdB family zinc ribbon protein [Desulfolutivibrio sulfoxidireducens]|uniref:FmdB family zinc ribbon protein n=1 Tax=Desulfolutivibrio sulfoxidireducens TaxID=2773299 RepID=UPI00159DCA10|nr:zinc ribbon domain-containing protein [Desulfolutivibrio sulfoxidireducens]QLA20351.1 zinc ribbon domain-containing protein [Desulfolutivibrio sulfoxidireducens]